MVLLQEKTIDSLLTDQFSDRIVTREKVDMILDKLTNPDSSYSEPDKALHFVVRTYSPCSVRSRIATELSDFYGANSSFGTKYMRLSEAGCVCVGCPHVTDLMKNYKG